MTKAEKQHLSRVQSLGCMACRQIGYRDTPAEIHHPRAGAGAGRKASHFDAIPLCPAHHRGINHPLTPSIHLDKRAFIARFGTEAELLEQTRRLIGWEVA
ncbi:Recombination enhancement, RecA-dependent nuclease [Geopseudomonas sagittaria]|uniref:Recombination enhancement, RecA-dependent nuclease n=1 Tax=Geopseudomonas sagittaria TaxID=1135990 RepID=A0A1I5YQC8_9GAMM|nr:Ref family recombination enhancement nuclease [Pseudomonas sagittaria]SFQ46300.1 Recombination enhancement, RecA-dependent nuclease [Pseudomonas sagittaria]